MANYTYVTVSQCSAVYFRAASTANLDDISVFVKRVTYRCEKTYNMSNIVFPPEKWRQVRFLRTSYLIVNEFCRCCHVLPAVTSGAQSCRALPES